MESFPAIIATEKGAPATLSEVPESALPEGDVTVDVHWSSLNYKDGLAVTGKGRIVRSFPMVCGIDLAGTVRHSDSADWSPGDEVIVTGWGLSETHPGGYTTRQRVRAQWLQRRPEGLSLRDTMAIGTGGLTAMLCVMALEEVGIAPEGEGEVLVTGAGGGVGSFAVMLLAGLGLRGGGGDRPAGDRRVPDVTRRVDDRRPPGALGGIGAPAGEGAVGRRHRHGGEPDVGHRPGSDPLPRRRGRLRPRRRIRSARHGHAVHSAQRAAVGRRLRLGAERGPRGGMATSGH